MLPLKPCGMVSRRRGALENPRGQLAHIDLKAEIALDHPCTPSMAARSSPSSSRLYMMGMC